MQENLFQNKNFSSTPKITWLSHSAFEELNRCPRCFWLSYKEKIRLPEGIKSRLANRFDVILKRYFDSYRQKNQLPPLVAGKIEGRLQQPFRERYYFKFDENYGFYGKLDECLVTENGEHIPVDFKTASSDPRDKQTLSAYQNQIDEYLFLMEENGKSSQFWLFDLFFSRDESRVNQRFSHDYSCGEN